MQIKGTAVKSINDFVKNSFPDKYAQWLHQLPEKSRSIFESQIKATEWYPMKDAGSIPTKVMGQLIFRGDAIKAARESGRYSAEQGLKGVYKIFVLIASPAYIIQRASRVFSSYYSPSEIKVTDTNNKGVTIQITKFEEPDEVIENRIAGWIEKAFEITKCKNVKSVITLSLTKGASYTEITTTWD